MIDSSTVAVLVGISALSLWASRFWKNGVLLWTLATLNSVSTAYGVVVFADQNVWLFLIGYTLIVAILFSILQDVPREEKAPYSIVIVAILLVACYFALRLTIPSEQQRTSLSSWTGKSTVIVLAPMFEELCFRFRGVRSTGSLGRIRPSIGLSLLFAMLHCDFFQPQFYIFFGFSLAMFAVRFLRWGGWKITFLIHGMWNTFLEVVRI